MRSIAGLCAVVVGVLLTLCILAGIASLGILAFTTTDYFIEAAIGTVVIVFFLAIALQLRWAAMRSARGTAVLDLAFLVLALGGVASLLDIPEAALKQLKGTYDHLESRARGFSREEARSSAGAICRQPNRPGECETFLAGYRLMDRRALCRNSASSLRGCLGR
jgi:hypothetical protein